MTKKTFAARFLAARKAAGLTQQELAAKLGMAQGYIADLETGRKDPTQTIERTIERASEVIARFAEALGCEPEELWERG